MFGWSFNDIMNWSRWINKTGNKNKYQGHGTGQRSYHNGYKQSKNKKARAKNRAGKQARKKNR